MRTHIVWTTNQSAGRKKSVRNIMIAVMICAGIFASAHFSYAQTPANGTPANSTGSTTFANPLNYSDVQSLLSNVLTVMRQIIVLLALVFLVIGALLYITSAGESGRIETAKKAISASLIGLAIGIAAPSFLKEIGDILGWNAGVNSSAVSSAPTLSAIAAKVLTFLLSILGTIALIMLIVGSMMYLTSAGDEDRIDTGKKIFKYSLIGVIIAMASLVIVKQIATFFT